MPRDDIVPDQRTYQTPRARRFTARDAVLCVALCALLLVLLTGRSIRRAGDEMSPSAFRTMVLAVGTPAGWLADRVPLQDAVHGATAWLSPDADLGSEGDAFAAAVTRQNGVAPVTPDAFDPVALGRRPAPPRPLHTLLVTGDSLSMPLDTKIAQRLADAGGVKVLRDPHVGTGISKTDLVDWGRLSASQVKRDHPDAVVIFIGANEGFPMRYDGRQVKCCGPEWASAYAFRVRSMIDTYRQGGRARVYWLLIPVQRDAARQAIVRVVNAAIAVGAEPYRAQTRLLDMGAIFTPGGRYRAAMPVGGRETLVRESDGVHLDDAGAGIAADAVLAAMRRDWRF